MIVVLNRLVDAVESHLGEALDLEGLAGSLGTTEYHARRMFSSLAGMPLSEYVRRRRMTVAAAEVIAGDDLLSIAVRYGYGSTEAFGRAFQSVHGTKPADVRRDGGPLRTQPQLRFRLSVEGSTSMDTRIVERPTFRLIGHAARVPLIHSGPNPMIMEFVGSIPIETTVALKQRHDVARRAQSAITYAAAITSLWVSERWVRRAPSVWRRSPRGSSAASRASRLITT